MKDLRTLDMLQSFIRKGISDDDIKYLAKWLLVDYQNIHITDYIAKINEFIEIDFFDNNKRIKSIVDWYQESIEKEVSSIETKILTLQP